MALETVVFDLTAFLANGREGQSVKTEIRFETTRKMARPRNRRGRAANFIARRVSD